MNKLTIEFDPTKEWVSDEVKIAAPYDPPPKFFNAELGRRVDSVQHWMKYVREALDGQDVETGYGNGWCFESNAQVIKFETLNGYEYTIPTPLLLEALRALSDVPRGQGLKSMNSAAAV